MENQIGTSNQTTSAPSQWSGDWFVFNNGVVQGPLSAIQAFSMETTDVQGKPILISKKGFTQWYQLLELAEIFKVTEDLGRRVNSEKAALTQQQIITNAIDIRKQEAKSNQSEKRAGESQANRKELFSSKLIKKQVGPKTHRIVDIRPQAVIAMQAAANAKVESKSAVIKAVEVKNIDVRTPEIKALDIKAPDIKASENKIIVKNKDVKVVAKTIEVKKGSAKANKAAEQMTAPEAALYKSPITAKKASTEPTTKQLLQEYFFIRGRLRLGKIRSPWATAFFGLPLSCGLLWPFWMGSLLKEIFYHSANRTNFPKSVVVMGFIPGLHFYGVFRLAQLVREMEMQNKYKSVSPFMAATFAIFPPFAMAYLQDAANRHWLLHARHVASPKKP